MIWKQDNEGLELDDRTRQLNPVTAIDKLKKMVQMSEVQRTMTLSSHRREQHIVKTGAANPRGSFMTIRKVLRDAGYQYEYNQEGK